MATKLKIGDRVLLQTTDYKITDGNTKFQDGDTGVIIKLHPEMYVISWDRPGIGDSRRDGNNKLCPNCWAVYRPGVMLLSEAMGGTYHPLNWKIRSMYERQPYVQKQKGAVV